MLGVDCLWGFYMVSCLWVILYGRLPFVFSFGELLLVTYVTSTTMLDLHPVTITP